MLTGPFRPGVRFRTYPPVAPPSQALRTAHRKDEPVYTRSARPATSPRRVPALVHGLPDPPG